MSAGFGENYMYLASLYRYYVVHVVLTCLTTVGSSLLPIMKIINGKASACGCGALPLQKMIRTTLVALLLFGDAASANIVFEKFRDSDRDVDRAPPAPNASIASALTLIYPDSSPDFSLVASFNPASVPFGGVSRLEYVITPDPECTAVFCSGYSFDLTHSLGDGLIIESPADFITDCPTLVAPTIKAAAGSSTFQYTNPYLGSSCTLSFRVRLMGKGTYTTGPLKWNSLNTQNVTIDGTGDNLLFYKEFLNDPAPPDSNAVKLRYTLLNRVRSGTVTNISFNDDADTAISGLTFGALSNACGGNLTIDPPSALSFSGGVLNPEDSCTIEVSMSIPNSTMAGSYSSSTSVISYNLDGPKVGNAATDSLYIVTCQPTLVRTLLPDTGGPTLAPGAPATLTYIIQNQCAEDLTDIAFQDYVFVDTTETFLQPPLSAWSPTGFPNAGPITDTCGDGSSLTKTDEDNVLSFSGGVLKAGESCNITVGLTVPYDAVGGSFTSISDFIVGVIGGETVIGAKHLMDFSVYTYYVPVIEKQFLPDAYAFDGENVTLEYTIAQDEFVEDGLVGLPAEGLAVVVAAVVVLELLVSLSLVGRVLLLLI